MSRTKSAFWGTISSQVFMVISMLVNIVTTPIIVKQLSANIYGLSIIIFQITGYLGTFDFGLGAGISRNLAGTRDGTDESKNKIEKIISTSFVVYAIIGSIIAIMGIALAPFAVKIFNVPTNYQNDVQPIISFVCVLVGLQFLLRSISGIFFAHQRQVLSNSLGFALMISNTLLVLFFIYQGFQLWSFVYAQLAGFIINSLLNLYFFRKHYKHLNVSYKKFDSKLLKDMFSYGVFIFINSLAVQVVFQTDRVLVGSIISLTAVSIYSLTTKLPELATTVIWKITDNAFPGMVELSKSGNNTRAFNDVHDRIMQLTLSISMIVFWMVLLVSYPFTRLWVGEQFFAGTSFIILVSGLYLIYHTILHVTAVCLNGAGFVKGFSLMSLVEASLNILLSILLCRAYGLKGAVLGTLLAGALTNGWFVPFIAFKYVKFNWKSYFMVILKPVIVCSSFGITLYFLFHNAFRNIDSWFKLIVYGGGVACFFCCSFLYNQQSDDFKP